MRARAGLCALLAAGVAFAARAQDAPAPDRDLRILPRLLQFEALLGVELSTELALCMDAALGSAWLLPARAAQDAPPVAVERARRAAEVCDAARAPEDRRLAEQLRARIQAQAETAAWIQERLPAARACLTASADLTALRRCVVASLGAEPSPADWQRWRTLFERSRR